MQKLVTAVVAAAFVITSVAGEAALAVKTSIAPETSTAPGDDPATITVPELAFTPSAEDAKNFDKYFYFHREGTDFAAALADIRECDGYARGLSFTTGNAAVPYPYAGTVGGALGGALGNALADAIYGSAMRRQQRRLNMRTCMGYKEYKAYGLPKSVWTQFHFEEGNATVAEDKRQLFLRTQAKVASGPKPQMQEITQWTL